jgi:hypothetical protein
LLFGILEISIDLFGCQCAGGDERIRTADPLLAKQVLSQLSYIPWVRELRYSDTDKPMSPSACEISIPREVSSDLESLKSGKDRNETLNLFVCFCTRTKRTASDFHRALSRLPHSR